ncbi:ABC transporter ATP-binding protein [Paenibacillus vini]|uniref:ABC transporter ATP-binding protein n=1 Tax=Paenibacillus vini TaxID=1476024 RepID=UPI0025B6F2CF|nr:ABC transporter ATP-binding protein [Paenibacillus vini]MDN4066695.1 ABC transporter ATP-binding protein [Paenibacillus vini]
MRIYLWCISYLKRYISHVIYYIILSLLYTIGLIAIPKLIKILADEILVNQDRTQFHIWICIVGFVTMILILANFSKNRVGTLLQERVVWDIKMSIMSKVRRLGVPYFESHSTGEILALFYVEVDAASKIYQKYIPGTLQTLILLMSTMFVMISMNAKLALAAMSCFFAYYLIGPYFEKKAALNGRKSVVQKIAVEKQTYESISGIMELRSVSQEQWSLQELLVRLDESHQSNFRASLFAFLRGSIRWNTIIGGSIVVFIYGYYLVRWEQLSVGSFIAFTLLYFQVMKNLTDIVTLITEQKMQLIQLERLHQFLTQQLSTVESDKKTIELPLDVLGELRFENVTFEYITGHSVLRNFNLNIRLGEKVALIGPSGSGKTTVTKMIGRLIEPTSGQISINRVPLSQISISHLLEQIGYMFQETYLYSISVKENILFGNLNASDEDIIKAAQAAYAHDFILQLPDGYNTVLGDRGSKLSGGQKQRIALARMFIRNPKIVILDEGTSSLDKISESIVQRALNQLLHDRITIAVAHRLSTLESFDRIIYLKNGTIVDEGTYEEMMQRWGDINEEVEGGGRG